MSDIENKKVQDILSEVAALNVKGYDDVMKYLLGKLGLPYIKSTTFGEDLRTCLNEIANRIDRQSVVEVTTPAKDPYDEIAKLYSMSAEEIKYVLSRYVLSGCKRMPEDVPAELEAMTPAIIDVHDCIIDIRIEASDD